MADGKWITYPLQVPPSRLWYQYGDEGTRRLEESPHAIGAREILSGMAPHRTLYAEKISDDGSQSTHGKPDRFAMLIASIGKGWSGAPVIAGINRRGEIVIHDGWHRSAAALANNLPTMPVAIHYRSDRWFEFRHALRRLNGGCKLYQPVDHPDFYFWPCWRRDMFERNRLIIDTLHGLGARTVADVGCHTGVLSCALGRSGFQVDGFDINDKAINAASIMSQMTDIGSDSVRFRPCPPFGKYNAAVALSVLNHFFVKGDEAKTREFLAGFSAPNMIIDCPTPGDPVGGDSEFTNPEYVFAWLARHGVPGRGEIIAERGQQFQRTVMRYARQA